MILSVKKKFVGIDPLNNILHSLLSFSKFDWIKKLVVFSLLRTSQNPGGPFLWSSIFPYCSEITPWGETSNSSPLIEKAPKFTNKSRFSFLISSKSFSEYSLVKSSPEIDELTFIFLILISLIIILYNLQKQNLWL